MKKAMPDHEHFVNSLHSICTDALGGWAAEKGVASEEYQQNIQESEKYYDAVKALLGEQAPLLDKFEEAYSSALCTFTVPNYLQGFRDCLLLLRELDLL